MDQKKLDEILEKQKGQPVGWGYIDIIVSRDNYIDFVNELVQNGFKIKSISWWEWCPNESENNYGLGGPKSRYFNGWFSELPIDLDDIKHPYNKDNDKCVSYILNLIETKTISYADEKVSFKRSKWLTPAFWIDVPEDWRNKYYTK